MVLQEYEAWENNTPLMPPVTRLYHLPPVGLGTPMVESLTGYIIRPMRVGRGAVSNWQRAKTTPGLPLLSSMAYRLGISLLDLLLEGPTCVTSRGFVRAVPVEVSVRSQQSPMAFGRRIRCAEVSRLLHIALKETPPPSVEQVMKRLSHSAATIYRHFPELCRQIARHYAEYRAKCALARNAV